MRAYRSGPLQFTVYCDGALGELTAAPVRAVLADIDELSAATRKRKYAIDRLLPLAVRYGLLEANPIDKTDTIKVPKTLPRPAAAGVATVPEASSAAAGHARICRWTG